MDLKVESLAVVVLLAVELDTVGGCSKISIVSTSVLHSGRVFKIKIPTKFWLFLNMTLYLCHSKHIFTSVKRSKLNKHDIRSLPNCYSNLFVGRV